MTQQALGELLRYFYFSIYARGFIINKEKWLLKSSHPKGSQEHDSFLTSDIKFRASRMDNNKD